MQTRRRLNVIEVSGRQFLLTATAGDAVHLTREADGEEAGKAALPDHDVGYFERSYDRAPIVEPRWAETTLCVVQVVTDTVLELGHAELRGVPGDHQAALRAQVRSAVRKRTGYGLQSHVHENMVIFVCDPIYRQHADENSRAAADAMDAFLTGKPALSPPTPWRLHWDTWAAS